VFDAQSTGAAASPAKRRGNRPGSRRRRGAPFLAIALAWMLVPHASAAEPLSLTAAVGLSLENSPQVLGSRAQAATARAGRQQVRGMGLPALEIREVGLRTNSPADAFGLQLMQERFSFPAFTTSDPNDPAPINNFATEFQATMPLFTGGKLHAARRAAGRLVTAADDMTAHTEAAIALETAKAYMNVLLADDFVALARRARETTAKHVTQAQDYFDAGMLVESDLLQAQVQLARMDENLITAENNAQLARAGLNRVMGVDQGRVFELETPMPEMPAVTVPLDSALARALATRRDLVAVATKTAAAQDDVSRASGDYWPEIGVLAKYALNDDRLFGTHGDSYTVMGMARWTPWNWGETQGRVGQARGQHAAAVQAERAYRDQVEFEVRQAWQAVAESRARAESAERAAVAAERAMRILEDRFSQGVARVTELLDAETLAHEARVREAQARFDLQRALRTISFATGQNPVPEFAAGGTTTR
jgi:outer membrane protein